MVPPHVTSAAESLWGSFQRDPTMQGLVQVSGALLVALWNALVQQTVTYIPLYGTPGSFSMMQNPGDDVGYASLLAPNHAEWRNAATLGSLLPTLVYRPQSETLTAIAAPSLRIAAEQDTPCPAPAAREASQLLPNAQLLWMEGLGHFDVYRGEPLEKVLAATVEFWQTHLKRNKKETE